MLATVPLNVRLVPVTLALNPFGKFTALQSSAVPDESLSDTDTETMSPSVLLWSVRLPRLESVADVCDQEKVISGLLTAHVSARVSTPPSWSVSVSTGKYVERLP